MKLQTFICQQIKNYHKKKDENPEWFKEFNKERYRRYKENMTPERRQKRREYLNEWRRRKRGLESGNTQK